MNAAQLGYYFSQFIVSLLFASVYLLLSKMIPSQRNKLGINYSIAAILSFIPTFVIADGPSISGIIAALLCVALLFWQYKRAKAKLRKEADND